MNIYSNLQKAIVANILITLIFLIPSASKAQILYNFTTYNSEKGFAQKDVMKIIQDQSGQMWFATWDGLYRYDGFQFYDYKARPGDGIRLESNRLENICNDKYCIWMRGYNGNISFFNKILLTIDNLPFENYVAQDMQPSLSGGIWIKTTDNRLILASIDSMTRKVKIKVLFKPNQLLIHRVYQDPSGKLWILTSKGIWSYNQKMKLVREGFDCFDLIRQQRYNIFCGTDGRILIINREGTFISKLPTLSTLTSIIRLPNGNMLISTKGDGLFVVSNKFTVIKHFTTSNSQLNSNQIINLKSDTHHDIWFCTGKPGVMRYNSTNNELSLLQMKGEFSIDPSMWKNDVKIVEDRKGNTWISPSGNGLAWFDRTNNRLIPFFDEDKQKEWTAENDVVDMFVDKQDNLWFCGKYTGLQKATSNQQQFHTLDIKSNTESGRDVRGIFQDHEGRIWIGAKNGVISVFDHTFRFLGNLTYNGRIRKESYDNIAHAYCFTEDRNGTIWIGTKYKGLLKLTPKGVLNYNISHFLSDGKPYSLPCNDIFSIYLDRNNRLWLATFGGGISYISLNDPKHRFIHAGNELKTYPMVFNRTRYITSDNKNHIWVGTTHGLICFNENFQDPRHIKFLRYVRDPNDSTSLSYNDVLEIFFTHQGGMYVCTYGGGFCCVDWRNIKHLKFKPFTISNGLRSDIIYSVQEDLHHNLWFASEDGLIKFYPKSERIEIFSSRFFEKNIFINEGQAIRLDNGRLLYPLRNRSVMYFDPLKVKVSSYIPHIIFTRFYIGQTEQLPSSAKGSILRENINYTQSIVLPYNKNSINVEFSALDYRDPDNISYSYQLVGLDRRWNMIGNRHNAIYNSLPPGKYILQVRSTNSDGVWVNNLREIHIIVKPPFWQTGWAILIYLSIIISIIIISAYILFTILRLRQKVNIEREISNLKMKFFTDISHEIRTPLTLISGNIKEIIRKGLPDNNLQERLRVVNKNSNRLLNLVNQMLDIRKIESGKMKLTLQRVDLGLFIKSLMDNFKILAAERQIEFILQKPESPIVIWADSQKLDKIIFNLLSNAFRFTPTGKHITVTLEKSNNGALISVMDEGKGISKENQKKIFEIFNSDDQGSLTHQSHSGIGLALTKELVELHGGKIGLKSELGAGSTFIVYLPQNEPSKNPNADYVVSDKIVESANSFEIESDEKHSETKNRTNYSNNTLLIVEDNIEMREFICMILREDYNILEAENGLKGLKMALEKQPDLIISDYMMPIMDGIEMVKTLRSNMQTSHIPIIILSAKTDEESKIKGFDTGADSYIEKPFSADILRARINNLIERRKDLQRTFQQKYIEKKDKVLSTVNEADKLFMDKLTKILEENISNDALNVDDVAAMMGISRSVYFKKLKSLTGLGPNDFLKGLRMQRAAELIDKGLYCNFDIATIVGIGDAHYFSKCFKQYFGVTPTAWKKRK